MIEAGSSVASDNLPVGEDALRSLHVAYADKKGERGVEPRSAAIATWLPTSPGWIEAGCRGSGGGGGVRNNHRSALGGACNSYVPVNICHYFRHPDCSCRNLNPGYILACERQPQYPACTEGRAQTCQVKKGMSPSCKHFLSGREHFLNPGATKPFLIFSTKQLQIAALFLSPITRTANYNRGHLKDSEM